MTRVEGDQFSHRGRGLLLIGVVWALLGISMLSGNGHLPSVLFLLPVQVWAAAWIVTGAAGVFAAAFGAAEPVTSWAFASLVIPPTIWAIGDAGALALYALGLHHGDPRGWLGALTWLAVIAVVLHEASAPVIPARPPSDIGPL